MRCPACEAESSGAARFCQECGARLTPTCPGCGHQVGAKARFCPECGVRLAPVPGGGSAQPSEYTPRHLAEQILTSRGALEGERKQVTVLFADLKGSTELLANRDPEEARRLLDPVLERMMEAVHRYEGTVNQVLGDGIMALFGAPLAHEDHAARACYAALAMQEGMKTYAEEVRRSHAAVVKIRIGLNSGEVVVRAIGSDLQMDYTAVGQTTHLAARMEQIADPGAIVIAPQTRALAEGYVEVKSLGPVPVKGLPDPVEVYQLIGAGPARTRLQAAARRGLTRFVGRDAELEQLRRAQQLAGEGRGQVAAIVGEVGVGKSRLVHEFTRSHRLQGWLVLEGTSLPYGKATSYRPVIDLLKGYFKIQDRDDLREIREKVTGKLLNLDETLRSTAPIVLALLDIDVQDPSWQNLDPAQRRRRTLDTLKRLLVRESQNRPLLLVFEDLHWVDAETRALLDSLVESLPTARMLLLVNYRPEYVHGWGNKGYYTQLRIDPLRQASAEALLAGLLGDDVSLGPLKTLLAERTAGNPFFLEESVRSLVETGLLVGEPGAYRWPRPPSDVRVPATVQAVLAARVDRLPPEEKRLLQTAAAIGKDVPDALLRAIADRGEEELRRGLAALQAAEFLYEASLFPELEYTFKHALTHEVTYGSLLRERRRELHRRIVDAIETLHADRLAEHVERLAHHALRAEDWGRGVAYARAASHKARHRWALQETVTWLEVALGGLQHLPESRETRELAIDHLNLGSDLAHLGEFTEAITCAEEGMQIAEASGDPFALAVACNILGFIHLRRGEAEQAVLLAERGLERGRTEDFKDKPNLYPLAWGSSILGAAHSLAGRLALGVPLLEEALEVAASRGPVQGQALWAVWLGEAYLAAGRIAAARQIVTGALGHAVAQQERGNRAFALRALGQIAASGEPPDLDEAETRYREALELAEALELRPLQAHCHLGLGTLLQRVGRLEQARSELSTAIELFRSMEMTFWLPQAEAELAEMGW